MQNSQIQSFIDNKGLKFINYINYTDIIDDVDELIKFTQTHGIPKFISRYKFDDRYYFYLIELLNEYPSYIGFCYLANAVESFKYLLLNGAKVTEADLYMSLAGGSQEIFNILKERVSFKPDKLLEISIKFHRYSFTKWILGNFDCYAVPLSECIKSFNINAFFYYLKQGLSLTLTEMQMSNPLIAACKISYIPMVQYIQQETKDQFCKLDLSSPFYYVVSEGCVPLAKLFINEDPTILHKPYRNQSVLNIATKKGNLEMFAFLSENGVLPFNGGTHPFIIAINHNKKSIVSYILQNAGLSVNANQCMHSSTSTLYDISIQTGNFPFFKFLFENVGLRYPNDYPLIKACEAEDLQIVEYLMDKITEPLEEYKEINRDGETPLHIACKKGNAKIVQLLLDNGANINATDNLNGTPLDTALFYRHNDLIPLLQQSNHSQESNSHDKKNKQKQSNQMKKELQKKYKK